MPAIDRTEMRRVESYLRDTFRNEAINLRPRQNINDSVEVYLGSDFIGVVHKLEDEDTGEMHPTNVACRLLNRTTGQCSDYKHRHAYVPDCVQLTPRNVKKLRSLPETCAYRLVAEGKDLYDWHHLISGDRNAVHKAGMSVRGRVISEKDAGDLEDHIVDWK